jgi:secreted trypsin-like serine protease
LQLLGVPSDLGFGADEVGIASGDSGRPLFIDGEIAGVQAFVAQPSIGDVNCLLDSSWGEGSFFTPVSTYRDFILKATDGAAIFVPEPSTIGPLVAVVAALAAALRSQKRR